MFPASVSLVDSPHVRNHAGIAVTEARLIVVSTGTGMQFLSGLSRSRTDFDTGPKVENYEAK